MGQISFSAGNWLPLAVLFCVGSVLLLAVCVRKYFQGRAAETSVPADSVSVPQQVEVHPALSALRVDEAVVASIDRVMQTWAPPPDTSTVQAYPCGEEDQRQGGAAEAATRTCEIVHLREALTARVASDRVSAQGLRDLVRALYLDQSNFRFHDIAQLEPGDKVLARALIDQWMTDPSAVEYWEQTYVAVCENPNPAPSSADRA